MSVNTYKVRVWDQNFPQKHVKYDKKPIKPEIEYLLKLLLLDSFMHKTLQKHLVQLKYFSVEINSKLFELFATCKEAAEYFN